MKVRKISHLFCLLMASGGTAWGLPADFSMEEVMWLQQADKIEIQGTIVDVNGNPLIGVSILEKGTANGTITDLDGKFSMSVAAAAQLEL